MYLTDLYHKIKIFEHKINARNFSNRQTRPNKGCCTKLRLNQYVKKIIVKSVIKIGVVITKRKKDITKLEYTDTHSTTANNNGKWQM